MSLVQLAMLLKRSLSSATGPVVLTDTAGIRDASETIERLGIETAWQRWRKADLGLLVVDATVGWISQHDAMLDGPATIVVVLNKVDAVSDRQQQQRTLATLTDIMLDRGGMVVTASARLENGIDEIVQTIGHYLDSCRPSAGSGIPFALEQIEWLERQRASDVRDSVIKSGTIFCPLIFCPMPYLTKKLRDKN